MPMNATAERNLAVLAVGVDPGDLAGCTVERAEDMLGALAHLSDGGFDVVIATLHLADASGADVVRGLRERAPDVPVIAIAEAKGDLGAALGAGASDVLPPDAAADTVARSLRYATSLQRVETMLHRTQTIDEVTGLFNARGFEQLANHHFRLADRSKHVVSIVFVRLEEVDDPPDESDVMDAANLIHEAVRASDVVARVGADAFCILLAGAASGSEPIVLSRIVEAVAANNAKGGLERGPSLSVGSASYDPEHPVSLQELIAEADRRMRSPASPDGG
jgi:diguanylate cyclase (GGDEF)-like protein